MSVGEAKMKQSLQRECRHTSATNLVPPRIHIVRHGQSLHNVNRGYRERDPPLTEKGENDAKLIKIPTTNDEDQVLPDLILISPMTRTIQTAILAFPSVFGSHPFQADVQIWPELREAHDANCNKGSSRIQLVQKFPEFDFSRLPPEWDYPAHTSERATARAEAVRKRLQDLSTSGQYRNIVLITHRGFIAFLVSGERYDVCEVRSFPITTAEGTANSARRFGTNVDTGDLHDFGPTLLVPASEISCATCER